MKALTVQQPWAWAIFNGKNIENRTQLWAYRGPLAIHAGARWASNGDASDLVHKAFQRACPEAVSGIQVGRLPQRRFPMAAIIGLVDLADVHRAAGDCCQPWGEHGYTAGNRHIVHLVLESPSPLAEPIPCSGQLGLWTPPVDIAERLQAVAS